jgi:phosphatidate cytidylyltransferase
MLTPIITDTFAYLGGSLIGKHHFTKISPHKTIEGCIIGSLMGTFMMSMYYVNFIGVQTNLFKVISIILLMTIIGQVGDLFYSAIKRHYEIKDFSNLIPGHGGILDRIDSLSFVAIVFMIFKDIL